MYRKSTPSPLRNRSRKYSHSSTHSSSTFNSKRLNINRPPAPLETEPVDFINGIPVHLPPLNSANFDLWEADMKVYMEAKGMFLEDFPQDDQSQWNKWKGGKGRKVVEEDWEVVEEESEERREMKERCEQKAMVWFSVTIEERRRWFLDLAAREFGREALWERLSAQTWREGVEKGVRVQRPGTA